MISALDELRSVVRCIEIGAEDFLAEPFRCALLRAGIGATLKKSGFTTRAPENGRIGTSTTAHGRTRAQLDMQASQVALTGLANRRSVDLQLGLHADREAPFTVFYIDMNFKNINDTYRHQAGDDYLSGSAIDCDWLSARRTSSGAGEAMSLSL